MTSTPMLKKIVVALDEEHLYLEPAPGFGISLLLALAASPTCISGIIHLH
jgi:hypothetical protein